MSIRSHCSDRTGSRRDRGGLSCEALESRVFLDGTPFPSISDLEVSFDPVYRIETSLGTIDIEMLAQAAPQTIAQFDRDFRAGIIDETVFHRSLSGQILQMGIVQYQKPGTPDEALVASGLMELRPIPISATVPPTPQRVFDEVAGVVLRDPLQWTVSYSEVYMSIPTGSDLLTVGTATALSFNLVDNPVDPIDASQPGVVFTARHVIGRILPGHSRDVLTAIAALPTVDSSSYAIPDRPFGFLLGNFPTRTAVTVGTGEAPPAGQAVEAIDVDIIKELNVPAFYTETYVYPEGWSSPLIDERLLLHNPAPESVFYEIVARYENGVRDQIVGTSMLAPTFPSTIWLSQLGGAAQTRPSEPYALEIHVTGPIMATMYHRDDFPRYDSGRPEGLLTPALGAEAFFSRAGHSDDELKTWDLALVTQGGVSVGTIGYVLWDNLSDRDLNVTVTIYGALAPRTITTTVGAHRRGGLEGPFGLGPDGQTIGPAGVRVEADGPIVVSTTVYGNDGGPYDQTFMSLGTPGGGLKEGAAPGRLKSFNANFINIMNTGSADATVTLFIQPDEDAQPESKVFTVPARRVTNVSFQALLAELYPGASKTKYALWYESTAPVALNYWSEGDGTEFASRAASIVNFADGSLPAIGPVALDGYDPGTIATTEEIAVFNPFADRDITFTLTYSFLNHETITTPAITVGPRRRVVAQTAAFADVFAKIRSGSVEDQYAIWLHASAPVVAQLSGSGPTGDMRGALLRFGEISHMGNPAGTIVGLDDPMFD